MTINPLKFGLALSLAVLAQLAWAATCKSAGVGFWVYVFPAWIIGYFFLRFGMSK